MYPFEPLVRLVWHHEADPQTHELAELLSTSRSTIIRWRREGLSHRQADHAALSRGVMPYQIWPDWLVDETVSA